MRYECPICGTSFGSLPELSKHLEQEKSRTYKCPYCGKTYKTIEEMNTCLQAHIAEENAKAKERENYLKDAAQDYKALRSQVKALVDAFEKAHSDICTIRVNVNVTPKDIAFSRALINIENEANQKETKKNTEKDYTFSNSLEGFLREILNDKYGL